MRQQCYFHRVLETDLVTPKSERSDQATNPK